MRSRWIALALIAAAASSPAADPQPRTMWMMHGLSSDGQRALLQELSMGGGGDLHYRVVAVDTGKVIEDVSYPALESMPIETLYDSGGTKPNSAPNLANPALVTDLENLGKVLGGFPLGAGSRIAASQNGAFVAFNGGDQIYTATVDHQTHRATIGAMVSKEASYGPWLTPDGSLMFRRWNGKVPGDIVGKYELFVMPQDRSKPPVRIDQTAGVHDTFVVNKAGTAARFVASSEPGIQTCVVEVALVAPYKATKKACLKGGEKIVTCRLSPSGTWAACTTVKDGPKDDPKSATIVNGKRIPNKESIFRFRTLDVDAAKVAFDQTIILSPAAISDDGLALIDRYDRTIVVDSKTKTISDLATPLKLASFPVFRTPGQLVTERNGSVVVIDATKWKRVPHAVAP